MFFVSMDPKRGSFDSAARMLDVVPTREQDAAAANDVAAMPKSRNASRLLILVMFPVDLAV
jgi:hypothetical protein